MTDHQFTDLLDRATAHLAPGADLVAGGITAGRRARRRRLAVGAASAAAVVAVTGGVVAALPSERPDAATGFVADSPSAVPTPTSTPTAVVHSDLAPRPVSVTLTELLAGRGQVTEPRKWGDDTFRAGSVLLDGALVTGLVERTTLKRCGEQPSGAACDSIGDGFAWTASFDEPAPGGQGTTGVRTSRATFYTKDHVAITVTAYNAPAEKGAGPVSDRPVLTEAELLALAQDPAWLS